MDTTEPAPPHVVVPVLTATSLFELAVPCAVFEAPRYALTLCGGAGSPEESEGVDAIPSPHRAAGGLLLATERGPDALDDADLVIVPAQMMDGEGPDPSLLVALRAAHARGARIASLCTGAFVLAAAGLLDGRTVATHWQYAERLRRQYPQVRVDAHSLYVDDGDILSSAGTAAAIDLCLHLVRTTYGTRVAGEISRRMVVAPHREGDQAQFVPPRPASRSRPATEGLAPVLDWALARLHEPLTIRGLADRAGMSTRTFGRYFAREVGATPLKWLNSQRVAYARELLETTDLPVDVVAQRSGLGTGDGLRQHFRRCLGTSPAAYRRTFRG